MNRDDLPRLTDEERAELDSGYVAMAGVPAGEAPGHTKGPWYAKQGCIYSRAHEIYYSANPKDAPYIWRVAEKINGKTEEEAEANERLMAASPDLLMALRLTLAALEGKPCRQQAIDDARAAVAAAEGRS